MNDYIKDTLVEYSGNTQSEDYSGGHPVERNRFRTPCRKNCIGRTPCRKDYCGRHHLERIIVGDIL